MLGEIDLIGFQECPTYKNCIVRLLDGFPWYNNVSLTDHWSYIQLVYILLTDSQENTFYHNFQLPRELRLQLSFFQNHFHFIHYRFHRLLNNCQGELQLKHSLIFFKKHFNFSNSRIIDRLQGGLPEADGTVVVDHSLGDAAP